MTSGIVVHYRGDTHLDRCLESCRGVVDEMIVVDNEGIPDEIRHRHPDARVIAAGRNLGFGRAANLGLACARSRSVLIMNQDVVLAPDTVARLDDVARRSGAWIVAPRLRAPDGSLAPLKAEFPPPLEWHPPPEEERRGAGWTAVPWVAGAVVLLPEGHLDLRFDPRLFMCAEDEELCWRVWRAGGRVVIADDAIAEHVGGSAMSARWSNAAITRRTIVNRARMVRWHRGWRGLPAFVAGLARR